MVKDILLIAILLFLFLFVVNRFVRIRMREEQFKTLKANEETFRALVGKYETIMNNVREVIFQLNSEGRIHYLNDAWVKVTGCKVEESIGKNLLDFFLPEELKGLNSQIPSKILKGEFTFQTKDGNSIVEMTIIPLFNEGGDLYSYTGSINDISGHKAMEKVMKAKKQYVEQVNLQLEKQVQEEVTKNQQKDHLLIQQSKMAAIGEIVASIGHQWKQPLNSLSLLIQDVREASEYGEINDQYITRFTKEGMALINFMSQTIDDFRKFYFPNKSKSSFSLSESIEEALSIFSLSIKKHQIQVHFEYRGQQRAFGFQNEFRQAVLSILANTRDAFIGREEKNRRIFIKIVDCGEYYRTDFTDNAGGIASSEIDKIFDPYFTTKQNGSGLGLYLAKLILENMNGRIAVELTPEGSKFRLFMPKPDSANIQESA